MKDMTSFVKESFDEILYKKKEEMRNGFGVKGELPFCLVPEATYDAFIRRMFSCHGIEHLREKSSYIEYMGFTLYRANVFSIIFGVEI